MQFIITLIISIVIIILVGFKIRKQALGQPKNYKDIKVGVEYRIRGQYQNSEGQHVLLEEQCAEVKSRKVQYYLLSNGVHLLVTTGKKYLWRGYGTGGFIPSEE